MMITLKGNPRSTNNLYRFSPKPFPHEYLIADGKRIKEEYRLQAYEQWGRTPSGGTFTVEIWLYFGVKGRHDWDNYHKLSMDALTGVVWKDDSQIEDCLGVHKRYDKENPRIELSIEEI